MRHKNSKNIIIKGSKFSKAYENYYAKKNTILQKLLSKKQETQKTVLEKILSKKRHPQIKMVFKDYIISIEVWRKDTFAFDEVIGKRKTSDLEIAEQILADIPQWIKKDEELRKIVKGGGEDE